MIEADNQTRSIATRLVDIASTVSAEAMQLTQTIREVGDHARDIAALALQLDDAARLIEENTQGQFKLLQRAQDHVGNNEAVMKALAGSAAMIAAISAQISDIAAQSRILGLNARIEAARTGGGQGFAAVAAAMSDLASRTRVATMDISQRADGILGNVGAARQMIEGGVQFLQIEHRMISAVAETAQLQRSTSSSMAQLTGETVERMDEAATGIGRVASAVSIVGLLARQLLRKETAVTKISATAIAE